jgi:BASS family bile acid:Na+ symporter
MTAATAGIDGRNLRSVRAIAAPATIGILMNYVVLSSVILLFNRYFVSDVNISSGFVLVAAMPPAVAVIPFAYILKGDEKLSLVGTVGGYLAALAAMPLMVTAYFGSGFVAPGRLLIVTGLLVLLPLVMGRILNRTGIDNRIQPYKGPITNWGFFLVTYVIVGLNRDLFIDKPFSLVPAAFVMFVTTFLLGWAIELFAGRFMKLSHETVVSLVLMGTLKNYGVAGGLALVLFNKEAASPATIASVFMIVYIMWLEWKLGKRVSSATQQE